ncbi:uncharacterized protein LODBEIA_P29210 [Lodderomyces beijingensis]|uniref:DNA-directed RNA polymerase n=1 Tax=Lodderomyces beijingensis TaxID=1775926 RepID=A0ABP0ZKL7_9ASCO
MLRNSLKIRLQCRCKKIQSRHQATVASSPVAMYNHLIHPLRDEFNSVRPVAGKSPHRILSSSYLDLQRDKYHVPELEKHRYFTSSSDEVIRQPYEREVIYLKTMLESFASESYLERAYEIFHSLSNLVNSKELTRIGNRTLEIISNDSSLGASDLDKIINHMTEFCRFSPDERTQAVRLKQLLQEGLSPQPFLEQIGSKSSIRAILAHSDIIGADNICKIFDCEAVDQSCIPNELADVYKNYIETQNAGEEPEDSAERLQSGQYVNPMNGALAELDPVDSFGLKVVRHSLLGLEPEPQHSQKFAQALEEIISSMDEETKKEIRSGSINYYNIYKKLQTKEQQERFNDAFEVFNMERQRQLEVRGIEAAKEKWKHEFEEARKRGDLGLTKGLNAFCFEWYEKLIPLVQQEQALCKALLSGDQSIDQGDANLSKDRAFYAPFLIKIPAEKIVVVSLLEILKINATSGLSGGLKISQTITSIGSAVEFEYRTALLAELDKKMNVKKKFAGADKLKLMIKKSLADAQLEAKDWDNFTRARVGGVMMSLIMSVAKVQVKSSSKDPAFENSVQDHPAFYYGVQFVNGLRYGVIKVHNEIQKISSRVSAQTVQPQSLPMIVKPCGWNSFYGGGNLYSRTGLVRLRDAPESEAYVKEAAKRDNLKEVFNSLNHLGNTAWTINKKVFDVISHYWNSGEEYLSIPAVSDTAAFPEKPPAGTDPLLLFEYQKAMYAAAKEFADKRSQRCDYNYKLEIARAFIGEKLYLPQNLDFRGRSYPITPFLNHLGGDLTRSLFLFWEGKEVGARGLDWIKIQLANVYGIDKAPLSERIQFVNDSLQEAIKSAEDPYKNKWWTKAEKPWQALSVCFELAEAYSLDDPTKFISHLPIHQDGTCNGLQHYAALGGDIEGANQVNLAPADKPQDVYSFVAKLVEERLAREAAEGNELAKLMQGKVKRKVVKQTVMTNVYGVTYIGAVAQIKKQIDDLFDNENQQYQCAQYLATQVFKSIRELFENAHLIQDWLSESAARITKSVPLDFGEVGDLEEEMMSQAVIWTTPLGLPCVQPYRIEKGNMVKTSVQEVFFNCPSGASKVDARKQKAAFPPNFVHSLDATHMLMTAKVCGDAGMAFAAVHDSYWTHAGDIDQMNEILREQFVKLHSTDLVQLLRDEFLERYANNLLVTDMLASHPVAMKIKSIKKEWARAIGRAVTIKDELFMERKRLNLLKSDDPKQVELGRNLETTISVAKEHAKEIYGTKRGKNSSSYSVLVPLQFPEVPPKGGFDVNLIKKSQYFFS